jgi:hypothetical protein
MRLTIAARALVAVALLTGAHTASADDLDQTACEIGVGCVVVTADRSGYGNVVATPDCGPETVTCPPDLGGGIDTAGQAGPEHQASATCTWHRATTSSLPYVVFATTLSATPHAGGTMTQLRMNCSLIADEVVYATLGAYGGGQQTSVLVPKGKHIRVCISDVEAQWSDGHGWTYAGTRCNPIGWPQ